MQPVESVPAQASLGEASQETGLSENRQYSQTLFVFTMKRMASRLRPGGTSDNSPG